MFTLKDKAMREYEVREVCRNTIIGVMALGVMLIMMSLAGCATPKNTDRDTQIDYSGIFQQMQSRMDSLLANMQLVRKETSEKLSNLKVENKTVYLSPPDSTGKQYPTVISETKADKADKETNTTDTKLNLTIQRLVEEVSDLKRRLDLALSEKEKAVEMSWWDLHKIDVYACLFALLAGLIIYKKLK